MDKRLGFSLIELMVVMAIIAALMTAGLRIFNGMNAGTVSTSMTRVMDTISSARELAVTENCRTRFIIVTGSGGWDAPAAWALHRYGVLRVPQDYPDTSGTAPFQPVSQGEDLADGVYFRPDRHETLNLAASGTAAAIKSIFDPGNIDQGPLWGGRTAQYAYIEFQPSGQTTEPSSQNTFEIEPSPSAGITTNAKNYVRFGVGQYTGRVRFQRP
jgi:prepilin-type N-terminal cleavage/methylation domain-containing protein